jgi:NTE family protein
MKTKSIPLVSIILWLFLSVEIQAQELENQTNPRSKRPKVGLVLSGGGARGLAHIGVLEWFEKNHIPVDYLGGTSIGGLIGAMYATGMSPGEMRAFIKTINWVSTFGTGIRYQDLSFRRKEDRREYPVEVELGLKHGQLSAPPGLSTGIEVDLLIDKIAFPYSTTSKFDDLPTPFFCMATDIINAKEVVMTNGDLSSAMRATMSLPGIFPPVQREGKWLVDGGVLNNIPTDVMRSMGMDVVIAVNVGTPIGDERAIQSLFGVATQTVGVLMAGNERRNIELADILISPELGELTVTDFSAIDATADLGFTAAEQKKEELRKYTLGESSWQQYTAARSAREKSTFPVPLGVRVNGVNEQAQEEIAIQFTDYVGKPIQLDELEQDLTRLCGEGRYQSANYGFYVNDFQNQILEIHITQKTYAPPTLNFALGVAGSDVSDLNLSFGTRLTVYDIGHYGTEWRNDINVGFNTRFASEFYRPFGRKGLLSRFGLYRQGFFAAPRIFYDRGQNNFFAGEERVAEFNVDNYGIAADFGYTTWRTELRMGGAIQRLDASLSTGEAPIEELEGRVDYGRIRWEFDGANSPTIPTRGVRFNSEARYYFDSPGSDENFPLAAVNASAFKSIRRKGTLFGRARFGTTFNKEAAPVQKFTLGGPFNLGAYDEGEFVGNHEVLISAGYYHSIFELPAIIGRHIWAITWFDIGGAFDDISDASYVTQGSIGFAMDTKVGPFALIFAYGEGGKSNIYFSFGRFF